MTARFPVITGLGIVSAPGCGVDEVWQTITAQQSGLRPLSLFQSPRYGQVLVGEISRDLDELGAPRRGSRSDRLAWLATDQAIRSAQLDLGNFAERAGLLLGSSVGGSFDSERFLATLIKQQKMRARPTRFHECHSAVSAISEELGLLGPCLTIATACSSGAAAIAAAAEFIQSGQADVMLAGGADSLSRMTWGGFHSLLLVDQAGCRPFDGTRAGMSLGEGAAVLVLEAEETARQRGAVILGRLSGWGASCDAHHATAPHPEGEGAAAAMRAALQRAGLDPQAIDYLNAHGTGTRDNDIAEGAALRKVFGERIPPFSSTKRFFGHALAASGAIEAVLCVEALRRQQLLPNLGFSSPDPAIGLQPVTTLSSAPLTHVMSNSFGFGGNNGVLIFSKADATVNTRLAPMAPVAITGIGVIGPGAVATRTVEAPLSPTKLTVHDCGVLADTDKLSPNQRRRLSRLMQMVVLAARRSHTPQPNQRLAVAIGTGMGCLGDAGLFLENLIGKDEREPMPARFPASVHNAAAAQVAIDMNARELNSAPTCEEISFESALWLGICQLATGQADAALAGAVDELNKYLLGIGQRWKFWTESNRPGEGAVVASLSPMGAATALAQVTSVRLGRYRRPFDAEKEARWIEAALAKQDVDVLLSGARGWPELERMYESVVGALSIRLQHKVEHRTYKQLCGEYHSASGFGFSLAVDLVRQGRRGVALYTLAPRGGKAVCLVQPAPKVQETS